MPKGVEHTITHANNALSQMVIHSLMPKGVEHLSVRPSVASTDFVIHSLMPKGVEHNLCPVDLDRIEPRDPFVDAERR